MSSILTNTGAMIALQTLRSINSNLAKTQSDISTGKTIASAKDNAAVWAISKVMESDVMGFKGISTSLALGSSTVATARVAAEQVTKLLGEVKEKIIAAQEENQDRVKIQQDIDARVSQIQSIVGAAQFNGLSLLQNNAGAGATSAQIIGNTGAGAGVIGSGTVSVLGSLDRSSSGAVTASHIAVGKVDLGTNEGVYGASGALSAWATGAGALANNATQTLVVTGDVTTTGRTNHPVLAGDSFRIEGLTGITTSTAADSVEYVARDGDTIADVRDGIVSALKFHLAKSGLTTITVAASGAAGVAITNATGGALATSVVGQMGGKAAGGLLELGRVDVTTKKGAEAALAGIEGLTQTAIRAASEFGSAQSRIEIQSTFVSSLMDSLKSGIGALVDADMEEASARLQALQVQQQLGIQALSIANQAPQNILALFRG